MTMIKKINNGGSHFATQIRELNGNVHLRFVAILAKALKTIKPTFIAIHVFLFYHKIWLYTN